MSCRDAFVRRIWDDVINVEPNEWNDAPKTAKMEREIEYPFLSDASRVERRALSLGMSLSDWKVATKAEAFEVAREMFQLFDELCPFSKKTLSVLHEELLMANPLGCL